MTTLPCIVCGTALLPVFDDAGNQPSEGTAFHSYGHYGSTTFDPMNGNFLEINVCDECLRFASDEGHVLLCRITKPVVVQPDEGPPIRVGTTSALRYPVLWEYRSNVEHDDEAYEIEPAEVGKAPGINWDPAFRSGL